MGMFKFAIIIQNNACMLLQVQWGNKGTTEEGAKLKRAKVTLRT
jgi:hypothetical protein